MRVIPPSIQQLIREFNKLPGIGSKTSERFVFHLLRRPKSDLEALANTALKLKDSIRTCEQCYTYTENDGPRCEICEHPARDTEVICVVAEPKNVIAIEKTTQFNGLYHVLGGLIHHADGIGPAELRIDELIARVAEGSVSEVIIATNPTMEGETTALYIAQQLEPHNVQVTKIARGLPVGGDIEFADEVTLGGAIEARQTM